jgi:hypothetical protein
MGWKIPIFVLWAFQSMQSSAAFPRSASMHLIVDARKLISAIEPRVDAKSANPGLWAGTPLAFEAEGVVLTTDGTEITEREGRERVVCPAPKIASR